MALANSGNKIFTIEGASEKASLASSMLHKMVPNVEVISGSFDEKLPEVLQRAGKADFVFIDGNHKKDSTLKYFEEILVYTHSNSVIVLDDINWSPGMMQAWKEIQNHEKSRVCLDLFRIGIVLLNPNLQKENFTVFY
jgi:predicted O-methyltransferase YrrM